MTADELALLRGVEAAPDDDLPRLVYADWLDEHGRHVRAEFIRVQCELASIERRLPRMTHNEKVVEGLRKGKLFQFQTSLIRADPWGCLGLIEKRSKFPWQGWQRDIGKLYQRGFASLIQLNAIDPKFASVIDIFRDMVPRPFIVVGNLRNAIYDDDFATSFKNAGTWSEVNELNLDGATDSLLPHHLIPMMQPEYPSLRSFSMRESWANPGHICVICERLKAPNVEYLKLCGSEIVDHGVSFLHRSVYTRSLKEIDLSGNPLCRPDFSHVTQDQFPSLTRINLAGCSIMPQCLVQLRAQLPGVEVIC